MRLHQTLKRVSALSAVSAGQMILLQPGTYRMSYSSGNKNTITLSKNGSSSNRIYMVAANCGKAIFDFSFPEQQWVQDSYGFHLTGDYWYFKGIDITRAGYQGVYVEGNGNTFENCSFYDNRNSGIEVNKGGSNTLVINFEGNGNGFKLGGNAKVQRNRISNSVAWGNPQKGFDQNNNAGGVTLYNNTAYDNGRNFGFCGDVNSRQQHVFRNNVSWAGDNSDDICNASSSNNSWNGGVSVSNSDFQSVNTGYATVERNADGTLPDNGLFRLESGSDLINKGVDVGLPYKGSAPDLGAFERE